MSETTSPGATQQVDFYLLSADGAQARHHFVCRLIEKAYHHGHKIHVLTSDAQETRQLDQMLWTFSPGSFVPHYAETAEEDISDEPVTIGYNEPRIEHNDLLVNLTPDIPACYPRFQRVIEAVANNDQDKQQARNRYKNYRDAGANLNTHQIG